MKPLYELSADLASLQMRLSFALDESLGEVTDEVVAIEKELADTTLGLSEKADAICKIREGILAEADALDVVIDRLTKRAKSRRSAAERLKLWLGQALVAGGLEKLKTATHSLFFRVTQSVEITVPVDDLPDEFVRIKREANKEALAKAMKAGERFVFAELQERKGLQIK